MNKLSQPIFFRLTKVDLSQRTVEGIATAEQPDKTGEVCDYESTKPYYEKWSEGFRKATDGKSLGNVRAMHGNVAAGKVTDLNFNDEAKEISIVAKIIDDAEWNKVVEGVYTGFSQGGAYVKKWKDGDFTRYTAEPTEVSIVDNPCLASATFQVVKADGTTEMHKFHVKPSEDTNDGNEEKPVEKSAAASSVQQGWQSKDGKFHKTKAEAIKHNQMVEAEEIAKAATADITKLMGDIENKLDQDLYWKTEFTEEQLAKAAEDGEAMQDGTFPIKNENDLKNAIRAIARAKDAAKAKEHIKARAKALGRDDLIPEDWSEKIVKRLGLKVGKSLYDVSRAACLIQELDWLHGSIAWQDEGSEATGHLAEIIKELCSFLTTLVEEETADLVEDKGGSGIEVIIEAAAGLKPDVAKSMIVAMKGMKVDAGSVIAKLAAALQKASKNENADVHPDRIHAIAKCAGTAMQHCMKAMHAMHSDDGDNAEKLVKSLHEAADHLKKAHKSSEEIMQHCMKMGSKVEQNDDGDDESNQKMSKMQALNDALSKTIKDLTPQIGNLLARIDHLERQPAVRKGALFDTTPKPGHEDLSGSVPAETNSPYTIEASRMSPEDQRRFKFGK